MAALTEDEARVMNPVRLESPSAAGFHLADDSETILDSYFSLARENPVSNRQDGSSCFQPFRVD